MGIDGCSTGWVAVLIDVERGEFRSAAVAATVDRLPEADGVGVDMPIGLLAEGFRAADLLARRALGPRARSVFLTPPRPVLEVADHAEATQLAVKLSGSGVSRQAHGLRRKILEVDGWLAGAGRPVWEVHPEVSYSILAAGHLPPKVTWNGAVVRRRLLQGVGLELPDDLGTAGRVPVDDVLDAAVVAWSCRRLLRGEARCWPDPPQLGLDGRLIAIWA